MVSISADDLKSGMILAKSVRNLQGLMLLNAGARLTAKNIRILKSWGVSELFIEGSVKGLMPDAVPPPDDLADDFEKALKKKFSDVLDDPVMREIYKAARKQLRSGVNRHQA